MGPVIAPIGPHSGLVVQTTTALPRTGLLARNEFRVAGDTTKINLHFEFGSTLYLRIASNAGSILWL